MTKRCTLPEVRPGDPGSLTRARRVVCRLGVAIAVTAMLTPLGCTSNGGDSAICDAIPDVEALNDQFRAAHRPVIEAGFNAPEGLVEASKSDVAQAADEWHDAFDAALQAAPVEIEDDLRVLRDLYKVKVNGEEEFRAWEDANDAAGDRVNEVLLSECGSEMWTGEP